jgi:hypothetical protein
MKVAFSTRRLFYNRWLRRNAALNLEAWYKVDTVGRIDRWLNHALERTVSEGGRVPRLGAVPAGGMSIEPGNISSCECPPRSLMSHVLAAAQRSPSSPT